jgi:hypothetical protein
VVHFLKALQRPAQYYSHHLGVFGNIAEASSRTRFGAAIESAGTLRAVEGSEGTKGLALLSLVGMGLAESLVAGNIPATLEVACRVTSTS